jgi:heavy metal sensor kinase
VRLPIRTRLTLVFAGLAAVVMGVAATALLLGFRAELRRTVDEALRASLLSTSADPTAAVEASARADDVFAQYVAPDGTLVTSVGLTDPLLPASVTDRLEGARFFDREVRTVEERVPARILASPLPGGGLLVVGLDVEDQREAVARLTTLVAIGAPVVLVAISILGWILAGAALRPVERLRSEAAAISVIEPTRRLAIPRTGDELERLARTLNGMLDRLHEALDRERRFVDLASHELRTPLSVLNAEVDLALREPRSGEELEDALRSIAQEVGRLRQLTQDLLVLARSDRGHLPVHRSDVDVSEILDRVTAEFAQRAGSQGVHLRTSGASVRARVDADRLRQAVENLIDNALRHTGRGGDVQVEAERAGDRLRLIVSDTGPGFPPDLLQVAFEPFARADGGREADGAGLGLAIVRAVAEAHGGTASLRNRSQGGASISLDLPA